MRLKKINNKSGFTLLEIIIVILILAVLASIMMPKFGDMINTAKENAAEQAARNACEEASANSTLLQVYTPPTITQPECYTIACINAAGTITCTASTAAIPIPGCPATLASPIVKVCTWVN